MNENQENPCVYAIQSKTTNRIYIGQTIALDKRVKQHNLGRVRSTKVEVPWEVIAIEFFSDQAKARWIETNIKQSKGKRLAWIERNRI